MPEQTVPDSEETARLRISSASRLALLRVMDPYRREVAIDRGELDRQLERGIYLVEAQLPGARVEREIIIRPGDDVEIAFDDLAPASIAPFRAPPGSSPAQVAALDTFDSHATVGKGSGRLVVYSQTLDGSGRSEAPVFTIRNAAGRPISGSAQAAVKAGEGWTAQTINLDQGTYSIEQDVPGYGRRAQAVFVSDGKQTQLFMEWDDRMLFERAFAFIATDDTRFTAGDAQHSFDRTEAAFDAMASGAYILSPQDEREFLEGKFKDPMLGLIAAYSRISRGATDYDFLGVIANNLQMLLPGSPDAQLIDLIARMKGAPPEDFAANHTVTPITEPPMFAIGTGLLMDLAARIEPLVPVDSNAAGIAVRRTTGSAWTRWSLDTSAADAETQVEELAKEVAARDPSMTAERFAMQYSLPLSLVRRIWGPLPAPSNGGGGGNQSNRSVSGGTATNGKESGKPEPSWLDRLPPWAKWAGAAIGAIAAVIVVVIVLVAIFGGGDGPQPDPTAQPAIQQPGPPASVAVSASLAEAECDGFTSTPITATVVDEDGLPVADGTTVTFEVDGPGTLKAADAATNAGTATVDAVPDAGEPMDIVVKAESVEGFFTLECKA
jgi:hypothetical protein